MKIVYASRTGNVRRAVERLMAKDPLRIVNGSESIDEEYILMTYTDGRGQIPKIVDTFLEANADKCKTAAVFGNMARHADTFCGAADKIEEKYGIPIIARMDTDGDADGELAIRALLRK
jgi:protein involved in ribonucleotide reduction